jgi:hypothetical protein
MACFQNEAVPRVLRWAADSGAAFDGEKTTLIHFTDFWRTKGIAQPLQGLRVGQALVAPSPSVKILGVIFDRELRFRDHVARSAKRGWHGVQALYRLRGTRPATARQLYYATVASMIDYAAAVWFSQHLVKAMPTWMQGLLTPIERTAAKGITNCFRTVSVEAACAEVYIVPVQTRLQRKVMKFWVETHVLPKSNRLWECMQKAVSTKRKSLHKSRMMFLRAVEAEPSTTWKPLMQLLLHPGNSPWGRW